VAGVWLPCSVLVIQRCRDVYSCKFPTHQITGTQKFNFAPEFSLKRIFSPIFVFLGANFLTRREFSDRLRFRVDNATIVMYSACWCCLLLHLMAAVMSHPQWPSAGRTQMYIVLKLWVIYSKYTSKFVFTGRPLLYEKRQKPGNCQGRNLVVGNAVSCHLGQHCIIFWIVYFLCISVWTLYCCIS